MIERNDFEAAMWDYYLGLKAKGWSAPEEGERVPPALFWREESGKYGVLSVEAAWNGWQMARKSVVPAPGVVNFQQRVQPWMLACFGEVIAADREERNHRFLEEALELVQSTGCTAHEAHQLVDYVYGRPVGEPAQEVGGVMVTLAALCLANSLDMHDAGEIELERIWTKVEAIRAKQAAKPKHSPLPASPAVPAPVARGVDGHMISALRWLLNITTEFDRKDVRTRQAARLLDDYSTGGKSNREHLEALWGFLAATPPQTAPVAQLSEPPDPFTDDEMVCAAWALLGAAKGTKQAKAFNVGARWARSHLTSASTIPKE